MKKLINITLASLLPLTAHSQIIVDGSLTNTGPTTIDLNGNRYTIDESLGAIRGSNLFHTFSEFGIESGNEAVFSGPGAISNIIAQVTGSNASTISGLLTSEYSGANFYLLNPNGIMFGNGASINISGAFHAIAGNSLTFDDGFILRTDEPITASPLLTSAAPDTFGFMGNGNITIERTSYNKENSFITGVTDFSLTGDTITTNNATAIAVSDLSINGRIINITNSKLESSASQDKAATVSLSATESIHLTGDDTSIRLVPQNSLPGNSILLSARDIVIEDTADVRTSNYGTAGVFNADITLDADRLISIDNSVVFTQTSNNQSSGSIQLKSPTISLTNGSKIQTLQDSMATGGTGDISIAAPDQLTISGRAGSETSQIHTVSYNAAASGDIGITAGTLTLENGTFILANNDQGGNSGNIDIRASGDMNVSGFGKNNASSLIRTTASGTSDGGKLSITADNLTLDDGARVSSGITGGGSGGNVTISVKNTLTLQGNYNRSSAPSNDIAEGDRTGSRIESQAYDDSTGRAGDITLTAKDIVLQDGATILSNSFATDGGKIEITADTLVSNDSAIKADSRTGSADSGNITFNTDAIALINGSEVQAQADDGGGGTITFNTRALAQSSDSNIVADSQTGEDGQVIINGSNALPTTTVEDIAFVDANDLLKQSCNYYTPNGEFVITSQAGVAPSPEGLLSSVDLYTTWQQNITGDTAKTLVVRAQQTLRAGKLTHAESAWQQLSSQTHGVDLAHTLRGLSVVQQSQGNYPEAVETLAKAITLAKEHNDKNALSAALAQLGNTLTALDQHDKAETYLKEAVALADTADLQANIYNNLGNYYVMRGQLPQAIDSYQHTTRLEVDTSYTAQAYAQLTRLAFYAEDLTKAAHYGTLAREQSQTMPTDVNRIRLLIHLAKTYEQMARKTGHHTDYLPLAHRLLTEAKNQSRSLDQPLLLSYSLGNLGGLYQLEGRVDEALALTRSALTEAEKAGAAESIYRWHWQAGQLLWAAQQPTEAINAYQRAVAVIEQSRQATLARYGNGELYFTRLVEPVYRDLIDALLRTADSSPDPQAHLLQARNTMEQLKTAELNNYFRDECVIQHAQKRTDLDSVADSAAIIYPLVFTDRVELLVSLSQQGERQLHRYTAPVTNVELTRAIYQYRQNLENFEADITTLKAQGQQLYQWLVLPYLDELQQHSGVDTLVFVPDGALRTIPMAALHNGERYLIEDFAIATTSSLSLTAPQPLQQQTKPKVLLAGISEAIDDFPALDAVAGELHSIKTRLGGDVLLNDDFTLERFQKKVKRNPYSIIHIASHAQFTGNTNDNFLLAYDAPISMSTLSEVLSSTKYRDQTPLELLVLSACETASGNDRSALGLAGAGLKAGARSALGSLWDIGDEPAADIIEHFYNGLQKPNTTKAQALRQAQLALLKHERFKHPPYWASFLLMDNWL